MCVIIYKPKGVQLPSLGIIEKAITANPHGFGICSPSGNYKGLSHARFIQNLKKCNVDESVLIHLRYATHGSVKASNCHPFYDDETGTYFMHNGILDVGTYNNKTDSECAFERYIAPVIKKHGLFSNVTSCVVDRIICGSRFAFMQGEHVKLFGDYSIVDGVYYSNLRFMPYEK